MKNLSLVYKILYALNIIIAFITLLSYLSYFISPLQFSFISFISLSIPVLILLNILFVLVWLVKFKKQFLLSALVLAMGYPYLTKFYSFSEKKILLTKDLKLMSYNVRMFNLYNWIENDSIDENMYNFITNANPDILCIQEFYPDAAIGFKYPYKYVKISNKNKQFGHAIFSKYKIVNSGALNFSNTGNNVIFADIVKNNDTIRIYNVHLESLKINPKKEKLTQENTQKFRLRVENAFKKQANQAILLKNHINKTTYKTILCGDFNNTAFSWVYNTLKNDKNDAFEIAGKGFGKTYNTPFPLRIDFILVDSKIEINHFKEFDVDFSDHYPIMAHLHF